MYFFLSYFRHSLADLEQMFTAGRYEYRNKGVDMFIESLARECFVPSHLYLE